VILTLYSKPGCRLCEELRELLEDLRPDYGFTIDEVNIQADAALMERYRHAIPVLLLDGREILRGKIRERDLMTALARDRSRT
jgi:glutaredoxin